MLGNVALGTDVATSLAAGVRLRHQRARPQGFFGRMVGSVVLGLTGGALIFYFLWFARYFHCWHWLGL